MSRCGDAARPERPDDRRRLHEVGSRADDVCYGSGHGPSRPWAAGGEPGVHPPEYRASGRVPAAGGPLSRLARRLLSAARHPRRTWRRVRARGIALLLPIAARLPRGLRRRLPALAGAVQRVHRLIPRLGLLPQLAVVLRWAGGDREGAARFAAKAGTSPRTAPGSRRRLGTLLWDLGRQDVARDILATLPDDHTPAVELVRARVAFEAGRYRDVLTLDRGLDPARPGGRRRPGRADPRPPRHPRPGLAAVDRQGRPPAGRTLARRDPGPDPPPGHRQRPVPAGRLHRAHPVGRPLPTRGRPRRPRRDPGRLPVPGWRAEGPGRRGRRRRPVPPPGTRPRPGGAARIGRSRPARAPPPRSSTSSDRPPCSPPRTTSRLASPWPSAARSGSRSCTRCAASGRRAGPPARASTRRRP